MIEVAGAADPAGVITRMTNGLDELRASRPALRIAYRLEAGEDEQEPGRPSLRVALADRDVTIGFDRDQIHARGPWTRTRVPVIPQPSCEDHLNRNAEAVNYILRYVGHCADAIETPVDQVLRELLRRMPRRGSPPFDPHLVVQEP